MNTTRIRLPLLVFTLALLLLLSASSLAVAQTKTYYWERFDVDIVVLENGDLEITERQTLNFQGAPFTFGFREVPEGRAGNNDGIEFLSVRQGDTAYEESGSGGPYTYRVSSSGDMVEVRWFFPPAIGRNTYEIRYRVENSVRTEPTGDQVFWNALPADLGARVENSTITLTLPEGIEAQATTARFDGAEDGSVSTAPSQGGRVVTYTLDRVRPAGTDVEVGARFPSGQLQLSTPGWQRAEQRADVISVILLVLSLLALIGGPLLAVLVWYLYGRDPEVGPVPDLIAEPPSDERPAVVGTLIDETAHIHDVMSTLVDLAERGYLTMAETKKSKDYSFQRTDKSLEGLRPFEKEMISGIFRGKETRDLDDLRYKFADRLPKIRQQLYQELEEKGYVRTSPESVRNRYGCLSFGVLGVAALAFFGLPAVLGGGVATVVCPGIALAVGAVALFVVSRYMPAKTREGAEAAAKWLAFKDYLRDIEKHRNLEEASDIFERYLAYAVAFGLERSWIRKFAAVPNMPIPPWYLPYPYYGYGRRYGDGRPSGGGGGEGGGLPSLEGMSGGLTGGLESMSSSLTRMLTNTQTVLQSTRSSSSSGGGGGFSGGFSGGSSGGGGGGFG